MNIQNESKYNDLPTIECVTVEEQCFADCYPTGTSSCEPENTCSPTTCYPTYL